MDSLELVFAGAVVVAGDLSVFNKIFVINFLLEFCFTDEVVVGRILLNLLLWPRSITNFFLEDALVLSEYFFQEGVFADAGWPNKNKRLSSQRSRVKWMEIFFCVYENVVL